MRSRVESGTDMAMIGAWDANRKDGDLARASIKRFGQALSEDALAGHVFVIHTGADGGGLVDVYLNEPVPESVLKQTRRAEGEFLMRVPSGRLVVGGIEDYRSLKPRITGENSVVQVPAGDYRLRCYVGIEEEYILAGTSQSELQAAVGAADYRYWRRVENTSVLGFLWLLLFPCLAFASTWKLALPVTLLSVVAWFYLRQRFVLRRDERYQRIDKAINQILEQAKENIPPTFVLELDPVQPGSGLKGGEVRI